MAGRRTRPRSARPAGGDHRPRRAEDDDQRAQLRRAGVHGRHRGLADSPTWAQRGRRRSRPSSTRSAGPSPSTARTGKAYRLATRCGGLLVRPRGWHLPESPCAGRRQADECQPVRRRALSLPQRRGAARRGSGPYFYLPKLESQLEAALWNDVFVHAQEHLGIPRGTIRATVLIETIHAAFEMDEILYELREHAAGLNAGRWDYLFSIIKTFRRDAGLVLPDRAQLTMTCRSCAPTRSCWSGPAIAAAPTRSAGWRRSSRPPRPRGQRDGDGARCATTRSARSRDGFDGTWVAHPDLVPLATEIFDARAGRRGATRSDRLREEVAVDRADLLDLRVPGGAGHRGRRAARTSASALQYLDAWLRGNGAAAIYNLMEDAATAEISRSQLWLWRTRGATLDDGRTVDAALSGRSATRSWRRIRAAASDRGHGASRLDDAAELLDDLVLGSDFPEFLTLARTRSSTTPSHARRGGPGDDRHGGLRGEPLGGLRVGRRAFLAAAGRRGRCSLGDDGHRDGRVQRRAPRPAHGSRRTDRAPDHGASWPFRGRRRADVLVDPADCDARRHGRSAGGSRADRRRAAAGPRPVPRWLAATRLAGRPRHRARDHRGGLRGACDVVADGYPVPRAGLREVAARFGGVVAEGRALRCFVARRAGQAIASALAMRDGTTVGLWNVATLPDARSPGRGHGRDAGGPRRRPRPGARLAVLASTPEALSLYLRLGFAEAGSLSIAGRVPASARAHPGDPAEPSRSVISAL